MDQPEDLDFADDISLLSDKQQYAQEKLSRVAEEAKTGLQVNIVSLFLSWSYICLFFFSYSLIFFAFSSSLVLYFSFMLVFPLSLIQFAFYKRVFFFPLRVVISFLLCEHFPFLFLPPFLLSFLFFLFLSSRYYFCLFFLIHFSFQQISLTLFSYSI
ncbi:unnamed protein product [Acanthosepion pharaonis]|uniref:Uncharacterized protein n=1 Tax=Acanthosepion pharaonis TaxID=158019 RepID=A0A812D8U2_ACAPH|nr:unnamed protein product [Sepia pharaonis]